MTQELGSIRLPKWATSENDVNTFKKAIGLIGDESKLDEIVESPTLLIDEGLVTETGIPYEAGVFIDPWGNPYKFLRINREVHVFSVGEDGKSFTSGNDPDDINSWNELSPWRDFYPPLNDGGSTIGAASVVLAIFAAIVAFGYILRKTVRQPR